MANVPNVPGVPPVARDPGLSQDPVLTGDTTSGDSSSPQWGLFKDGQAIIQSDNVASFEYKQEWVVADYPIEKGGFESYDKVQTPFDVKLRFSTGGSDSAREAFLQSIEAIIGTTDVYDAVMPEKTYISVNPYHYDFHRTNQNGLGLLIVDIYCTEIRENATATFTQTKEPQSQQTQNDGNVQSQDTSSSQQKNIGQHGATGSW